MQTVNLAAVQMTSGPDISENLKVVDQFLQRANLAHGSLVVLPECFVCFGTRDGYLLSVAEPQGSGVIQQRMAALAKQYGIYLVGGTIPVKADEADKFTASCFIYDPNGDCLDCYQKIHMFDVAVADNTKSYKESKYTKPGERVVVLETPLGRIGVAVCYDIRFPGLFDAMGEIDILVLPAAFTKVTGEAHWHTLLRARAIENQCFVVAANQTGTHENSRETFGHSVIYSPWGELLAEREQAPGIVQYSANSHSLNQIRQSMPIAQHNRFRSHFDKSS